MRKYGKLVVKKNI